MNKYLRRIAVSAIFVATQLNVNAQSGTYYTIRDFQTWSSVGLDIEMSKKVEFGFQQQLRLKDNSSALKQYFTEGYFKYNILKNWSFATEYRILRNNDTEGNIQGIEKRQRLAFNTIYSLEVKRAKLLFRTQYQRRTEREDGVGLVGDPVEKIRLRAGMKYNIKNWKLDPRISCELFQPLEGSGNLEKYRVTLGTKYSLKKVGDFRLFYRFERDINIAFPRSTHIVGFNYSYTIKRKKKKEVR